MGDVRFFELVWRLRNSVDHLDHVAGQVEHWPHHVHDAVCEEISDIAERAARLAAQIEQRPEGDALRGEGLLGGGSYMGAVGVPFPGTGVQIVYPVGGSWDEETELSLRENPDLGDSMEIVAYLDTDDQRLIDRAVDALESLADSLGYGDFDVIEEVRGSLYRRATSWLKSGVTSDEVALRLGQVERAIHLGAIDTKQAQVDEMTARAVESLVTSVAEIPRVAMRAGSILLLKYQDGGAPVVLVRQLSSIELNTLERHPGLQKDPESLLANLALVIQSEALPAPTADEG